MGFAIVSGRFFQVQLGWIAFFLSRSSSSGIVQQNYITLKFKGLFEPVVQYMGRLEQARYSHHVGPTIRLHANSSHHELLRHVLGICDESEDVTLQNKR